MAKKSIKLTPDNPVAVSLKSATTIVDVFAATAPTVGQVLTATSASTATWQTPSGGAPTSASYLTATAEAGLSAEVNLGALTTGLLKHTVAAGVSTPATATAGTDYSAGTSALATGILKSTTATGALTIAVAGDFPTLNQNTTGSAATLTTPRSIYGNNFDGTAALAQVIASTYGGTGNGFTKFSGATTAEKTYTLPDASTTLLTTNAAVTVAQGGTGVATLTAYAPVFGGTTGTGAVQSGTVGTAGQVLTSNGAGALPTFQAASAGTPTRKTATVFETAARFQSQETNGTNTYGTSGLVMNTSATAPGRTGVTWAAGGASTVADPVSGSPIFTTSTKLTVKGSDCDSYFGLGNVEMGGAGATSWIDKHIGFKVTWAASGAASLYATQADGTTENASAALTAVALNDHLDLILKVNSTTSVDYYWRLNGGALSAATNLTANLPADFAGYVTTITAKNKNTASASAFAVFSASYER